MRVLFASYDDVTEGPGRSQSLPYVRGLAAKGHEMALFGFERPELLAQDDLRREVEAELDGAPWTRIPRRGSPLVDLPAGLTALRRAFREHRADLVHARGYVPAFLADRLGLPFLFDMRGFWPDERVDGGLWRRRSLGYRLWKRIERRLLEKARGVVTLTHRAREELLRLGLVDAGKPFQVIPTCTDLALFGPVPEAARPPEVRDAPRRYLILGATGTWYLREEMLDLAAHALVRAPDAHLHVLTNDPPGPLREGLAGRGVSADRSLVRAVPAGSVPTWISGAEAAIVLIRSTWSKGASCPTKLGELLGCGVPVLMNAGIGDADAILRNDRVGVTVPGFDSTARDAALDGLDALLGPGGRDRDALAARCRAVAVRDFALDVALERYDRAYAHAGAGGA